MTIERADKKKNIDLVAASLAKNPLQSEREVAKDTWLGHWTVNRAKKEVGQTGARDERIQALLEWDMELLNLIAVRKKERMGEKQKPVNDNDVDKWENTAIKRQAIFW